MIVVSTSGTHFLPREKGKLFGISGIYEEEEKVLINCQWLTSGISSGTLPIQERPRMLEKESNSRSKVWTWELCPNQNDSLIECG